MPELDETCTAVKSHGAQIWCCHQSLVRWQSLSVPEDDVKLMERFCLLPQHRGLGGKKQNETPRGGSCLCTHHFCSVTSTFNNSYMLHEQQGESFHGVWACSVQLQQGDAEQLNFWSKTYHPFPHVWFWLWAFCLCTTNACMLHLPQIQ